MGTMLLGTAEYGHLPLLQITLNLFLSIFFTFWTRTFLYKTFPLEEIFPTNPFKYEQNNIYAGLLASL
jgi:hypothetical protein